VDRHPFDLLVLVQEIDCAPVGDLWHGELRYALERLLVVERGGKHATCLREEALGELRALDRSDVLEDVDRVEHLPRVGVSDWGGARHDPALLTARADYVSHQLRLRMLARKQPPSGHALQIELAPLLV
jgi:hypothetical protein